MNHYLQYLRYVLRHKWFVYKAGRKLGAPFWNLVWHDHDKFKWDMFKSYANKFYNFKNLPSNRDVARAEAIGVLGYYPYTQEDCEQEFNETWNRHQNWSRHHWQYHVRMDDSGAVVPMEMKEPDLLECVADWMGAGQSIPGADPIEIWYAKTKDARKLHPATQARIEQLIGYVA